MDTPNKCLYCSGIIDSDDFLNCDDCEENVHISCLKRPGTPGDLFGDVFFIFTCYKCSTDGKELFARQKLPWLMVITLAIYNLSIQSNGLSHHGFFHWRTHITHFIEKNWNFLFGPNTKRRKKWIGTVSGTLSHNSPDFFTSGYDAIHETGWWKLTYNQTPKFYLKIYEQLSLKRQQLRNDKRSLDEASFSSDFSNGPNEDRRKDGKESEKEEEFSRTLPYMGQPPKVFKRNSEPDKVKKELNLVQSNLKDFLAANLSNSDLHFNDLDLNDLLLYDLSNITSNDPLIMGPGNNLNHVIDLWNDDEQRDINPFEVSEQIVDPGKESYIEKEKYKPKMTEVTNFQETNTNLAEENLPIINQVPGSSSESENSNQFMCEKSLFTVRPKRELPWQDEEDEERKLNFEKYEDCERRPYMGRAPKVFKRNPEPDKIKKELNSVQSNLMDFLAANLSNSDLLLNDLPKSFSNDLLPLMGPCDQSNNVTDPWNDDLAHFNYDLDQNEQHHINPFEVSEQSIEPSEESYIENEKYKPKIIQVTNFKETDTNITEENLPAIKQEPESSSESEDSNQFICEKSLFTVRPKRELPWKEEEDEERKLNFERYDDCDMRIEPMSEYEEMELYKQLKSILNKEKEYKFEVPSYVRRFYRKLDVRNLKRHCSKPLFDIDNFTGNNIKNQIKPQVLDRYHHLLSGSSINTESSFHARLAGTMQYEMFESPHTSRRLHPFIFRSKCFPPWVKLMCEIKYEVMGQVPSRSSIDYCYVRPNHIAAVNALLQKMFWPGIDMSECLSYPDFSVVALYKKLVVGCGFLVPDVSYNEAYISFMAVRPGWQRSGIASFMLYHLTQTCMGKDITLHVSATNPAIFLYQKFGFKIEKFILDFYEKYLPVESKQSRHAFLLRMTR